MKTYINDLIPKIERFSKKLDDTTKLIDRHWVVINEFDSTKTIYIFRKSGELLITNDGEVEKAKWEYISPRNNLVGAYICAENEDSSEKGVIYNINVYDEKGLYTDLPITAYSLVAKKYLAAYENGLKASNMPYRYITYLGVSALEYDHTYMGLPQKSIVFLKDKKSYLLQVATRTNLNQKFNSIKSSFKTF